MSDYSEINDCVRALCSTDTYAFDLETTGLDLRSDVIIGVAITVKIKKAYKSWYFKPSPEMPCKELFKHFETVLIDTHKLCIMHNAKFDTSMLRAKGIPFFNKIADTMIMAWLVDENRSGTGRLSLKGKGSLTHELFGVELATYAQSTLSGSLFGKDEEKYAQDDTKYCYMAYEALLPELKKQGLEKLFWEIEMPILPIVADMEWRGMYLDVTSLHELDKSLVNKSEELEARFYKLAGRRINIGSTEQLSALFFDELKWPIKEEMERGANGCYPTGADILSKYAVQDNMELAQIVLEHRGVIKMLQTYIRPFKKRALNNKESRIYGKLHQAGTVTGRFCVSGDTLVTTGEGLVRIEHTKQGMMVYTHQLRWKRILNVIRKGYERMWHVNTLGGCNIRCTMAHQFLMPNNTWRSLSDLTANDKVMVDSGEGSLVEDTISWYGPGQVEMVWDIEVEDDHSYIGNGFVNHNSSSDPNLQNCFDDQTEVLTEDGWKKFCNLTRAELVCQFHEDTQSYSYAFPTAYVCKSFRGDLVMVKGPYTDMAMTPDHECLLWDSQDGRFTKVLARDYPIDERYRQLSEDYGCEFKDPETPEFLLLSTGNMEKSYKCYSGFVYCVTMPAGNIVIRRNGKISISGNCPRKKGTIKAAFKAPEGKTLICSDYSQLELRLVAHLSQDPVMLEVYRTGGDIHTETQKAIGAKERAPAKAANFGFIYGMSAYTFQANLWNTTQIVMPISDCKSFEKGFFLKYKGIREYHEKIGELLRKHKYVESKTHRRRHLVDDMKANYGSAVRQAINFTVQSLGADIMKLAMRNFQRELMKKRIENPLWEEVFMIMQVHDELLLESPLEIAQEASDLLKHCMETAVKISVPLVAEPKIAGPGGSWEDCK